jgi:oxygen-independent coproporphyrinogen III oxidase
LYVHIPFCEHICFYCACNKIATKSKDKADYYLELLEKEAQNYQYTFANRPIEQLHFGGGTPTFLTTYQITWLMQILRDNFQLLDDDMGEYSIEIDPRTTDRKMVKLLRQLGFNRLSLGVQDFNPATQIAINRVQSQEQVFDVIDEARAQGFKSISFDLIYGLPLQTVETYRATLEQVIELNPDRIAVFNYAHLPERFKPQRRIATDSLPDGEEKLAMLQSIIEFLEANGYVYIGMDHFAKHGDPLVEAQENGTLQRNFQGYSTRADLDMLGMGVSSISNINGAFAQNVKKLDEYEAQIESTNFAIEKGFALSEDDLIRRHIISELCCNNRLDFTAVSQQFEINFNDYFANELTRLKELEDDGLVNIAPEELTLSLQGRLLLRPICMIFDAYLNDEKIKRFSKVM